LAISDLGGPDPTLTYDYDDSPAGGTPIAPRPGNHARGSGPRWPGFQGRPRLGGWRWLKWPRPFRRLGDFLVFLAAADVQLIGSKSERYRYTTVGLLMLVTAAQAFYAATLFFSISLGKPFRSQIGFGVFFAVAVYLIDRSIISYASPIRLDKNGNLAPPRKTSWVLGIRVGIAIVAAMLMSEMILLQVFAGDITEKIQANHIAESTKTDNQLEASFQKRITALKNGIDAAQHTVDQRQDDVTGAYQAMNCQEFGCRAQGIVGGFGPGYAAAKLNWQEAVQRLGQAQDQLQTVRGTNQPAINLLNIQEQQAIKKAQPAIDNADKVLSQEEAFWQLTVQNGTVLVVRVLLSLLILGIDLAPILTKLTGRTSIHDVRAHSGDYRLLEREKHATNTAIHQYAGRADVDRRVYDIDTGNTLFQAQQESDIVRTQTQRRSEVVRAEADADADVELYRIKLDANLKKLNYQSEYMARKPPPPAGPAGGGNGGRPAGNGPGPGQSPPGDFDPVADPDDQLTPVAPYYPAPPDVDEYRADPPAGQDDADQAAARPAPDPDDPDEIDELSLLDEIADILFRPWEEPDLDPGETSGQLVLDHKWHLYRRLFPASHDGGGGIVWRAKNRLGDQRVWYVVKTVESGLVDKQTARNIQQIGLRHEMRLVDVVSDHVGEIIDYGDDRGFSYLVYPLYEPGSLRLYCSWQGGRQTLRWCAEIIREVLSGLIAAFDVGLVHLDIKPDNIVLDGERARVIDWGLSRVWKASNPSTWVAAGTAFYASPEQLLRSKPGWDTPRADLYGVGATFYWLLTGEAPLQRYARPEFDHDRVEYRKLLVSRIRPEPVHELVEGVPPALGMLIDRWLSYDPAGRVPPGTPMADSLRAARDELSALIPALPDMTVGQVTPRRRRRPK
jgi:Domain of unknown function (DUF4407)/Protein kinase domain